MKTSNIAEGKSGG